MAANIPLSVAICGNPGIMHWSLYVEAEIDAYKTTIQILGARQKYFSHIRTPSSVRESTSLIDLLYLCQVNASKIEIIKEIAYATPIRNDLADWTCQDYVLKVLANLEEALIIDARDGDYIVKRGAVQAKPESWA